MSAEKRNIRHHSKKKQFNKPQLVKSAAAVVVAPIPLRDTPTQSTFSSLKDLDQRHAHLRDELRLSFFTGSAILMALVVLWLIFK